MAILTGTEPPSHSWVLRPLPLGARGSQSICLLGGRRSLDLPDSGCRGGSVSAVGGGPVGGGAAAPWPSGELTRLEAGPGRCREWAGLVGCWSALGVHTHTRRLGLGPWVRGSAGLRGSQKEHLRDWASRGSRHTRGARSHRGVHLQPFSQLALARGPWGTHGQGAPRSAGPRPFPGGAPAPGEGRAHLQGAGWPARTPGLTRGHPLQDLGDWQVLDARAISARPGAGTDGRGATPLP